MLTGIALVALVAGVAATSAALHGDADTGVVAPAAGGRVISVSPMAFAWRDGIRPGQLVVYVSRGDDPQGWRLETDDGAARHVTSAAPADEALRGSLPLGVVGLGAGGLAVLFLRARRRWVLPATSLALFTSSTPLWLQGGAELSTAAMAGAALVPGVWLASRVPGGWVPRLVAGIGLAAFLATWANGRLSGSGAYDLLEGIRQALAILGLLGLVVERAILPTFAGETLAVTRPKLFDITLVAALAGLSLALIYFLDVSPTLVAAALVIAVLFLSPLRRRISIPVGNALLADVRAQAATQGAEQERERLARQLHDEPLQELVGVIRRLEILPEARSQSDELRAVARHLRDVAADLRPPVLDDFGLPGGLAYIAEEATTETLPVVVEITDRTGFDPRQRPPAQVELEVFRIAREAVANAVGHSRASLVRIEAEVAPGRVEVCVIDDGLGLDPVRVRAAEGEKRMGLTSMRRRAQAIDAELMINGGDHGTTITVRWQA